jgi:uncharacterized membrane protein YccF (DUF307 family)
METTATVPLEPGSSILVRAAWYLLVGWWLAGMLMAAAWFLAITIIGLPLAFYLVNRVPTVLTLRPRRETYRVVTGPDGTLRREVAGVEQFSIAVRLLYFVLVGWWLSAVYMVISYLLFLTVIGIPLGLVMVNRLPFVFSLHRGYA